MVSSFEHYKEQCHKNRESIRLKDLYSKHFEGRATDDAAHRVTGEEAKEELQIDELVNKKVESRTRKLENELKALKKKFNNSPNTSTSKNRQRGRPGASQKKEKGKDKNKNANRGRSQSTTRRKKSRSSSRPTRNGNNPDQPRNDCDHDRNNNRNGNRNDS